MRKKKNNLWCSSFFRTLVGGSIAIKKKERNKEKSFDPSQYQGVLVIHR